MALFGLRSLPRFGSDRVHVANHAANNGTPPKDKSKIRLGSVIAYTHLPGIFPRIRRLGQHFGQFAYLLALIYRSARLIPAGHPFLNGANVGRYGVRDVVATAASNLVMKRENIDQIMIFFAIGAALIMMVLQTLILLFYVAFSGTAEASTGAMFTTPTPPSDIVLQFLRNVFGVPTIFGGTASAIGGVQSALYALLGFYSTAIMLIAVIIVLYYVVTVVGESAQSGQPFGKRFNTLWAPVRLVLALGLLVPLGTGLNAAQYVTLYMASFGSGLASQGWVLFTSRFGETPTPMSFMGTTPDISSIGTSIFRFEACRALHNLQFPNAPVRIVNLPAALPIANRPSTAAAFTAAELSSARSVNANTMRYIWTDSAIGHRDPTNVCGDITVPIPMEGGAAASGIDQQAYTLQNALATAYISAMGNLVRGVSGDLASVNADSATGKFARSMLPTAGGNPQNLSEARRNEIATAVGAAISAAQTEINTTAGNTRISNFSNDLLTQMRNDARDRGWGTAGLYYIEIAKYSQLISDAISRTYPTPAEVEYNAGNSWLGRRVRANITGNANGVSASVQQVRDALTNLGEIQNQALASISVSPNRLGGAGSVTNPGQNFLSQTSLLNSPVLFISYYLFGDAFFRLADEPTLNPMSALIAGGGQILDRSQTFLALYIAAKAGPAIAAVVGGVTGLITGSVAPGLGNIVGAIGGAIGAAAASSVLAAVGDVLYFLVIIGLAAGIMLFYILPLMPFMYFFFSVVNWVIEVVEAVVAMPLFALSHLRIDGDGMPGSAAMKGYFTFFNIVFRPIVVIISLIFSMLLFGAAVYYLQSIYRFAVFNVRGEGQVNVDFSKIGSFGIIFYLIFYVYIIYILSSSIFKLIDTIPDGILGWVGASGKSFTGDRAPEIGNFNALTGVVGVQLANQLSQGVSAASNSMRSAIPKTPPAPSGAGGAAPSGSGRTTP